MSSQVIALRQFEDQNLVNALPVDSCSAHDVVKIREYKLVNWQSVTISGKPIWNETNVGRKYVAKEQRQR